MQTSKYVCSRAAIFVEGAKITLPIHAIDHATRLLNGWNGVRPMALKLCVACSTNECGGIATASKPMLLLPARKARRPKRYLFDDGVWDNGWPGISAHTRCIRELCVEPGVR